NKACAEAFIDFMCREDIAQMNMDYICYSTPIQAVADGLQSEDERAYAVMNPDADVVERCEFFHDIMDAMDLYEAIWMEIRLAR
ncbi:MAG: spermidine/putrescine ABC transporter substrate-binding protein, partial [Candidatus Faecivicinus sp.]